MRGCLSGGVLDGNLEHGRAPYTSVDCLRTQPFEMELKRRWILLLLRKLNSSSLSGGALTLAIASQAIDEYYDLVIESCLRLPLLIMSVSFLT